MQDYAIRNFMIKHRKKIIVVVILIVILIVVIAIVKFIINANLTTVNITVAPSIAKVKIGDKEYDAVGKYDIWAGEYDVEILSDGFVTKTGRLVLVAGETVNISTYLEPNEDNSDWYSDHPEDALIVGDVSSYNDALNYYEMQKDYKILEYVPYYNFNYAIGYENDCDENGGGICLTVDADFGFRRYATEYLQLTGQDLSWYYVKGYESPFRRLELSVPDGLEFSGSASGLVVSSDELSAVNAAANRYIDSAFDTDGYTARILQTKKYGDQYFGVTIAVYEGDGSLVYDIYRMIVGLVDGEYVALTNADVILSRYQNPQLPGELLKVFDSF